jgi:uncharacterized protein
MNKFEHMELSTDDPEGARKFYSALFGWKVRDVPMGNGYSYMLIEGLGGITPKMMPGTPTGWLGYIGVPNLEKTVEKARALGGEILMPRTEIPNMGYFAVFRDPTGGPFAAWEAVSAPAAKKAKKKSAKKAAAKKAPAKKAAAKKAPAKKAAKKKKKAKKR